MKLVISLDLPPTCRWAITAAWWCTIAASRWTIFPSASTAPCRLLPSHGDHQLIGCQLAGADLLGDPAAQRRIQRVTLDLGQDAPHRGLRGWYQPAGQPVAARAKHGEHRLRRVSGPLRDRRDRAGTGEYRRCRHRQHRGYLMANPTASAWVRYRRQMLHQPPAGGDRQAVGTRRTRFGWVDLGQTGGRINQRQRGSWQVRGILATPCPTGPRCLSHVDTPSHPDHWAAHPVPLATPSQLNVPVPSPRL